MDIKKKTLTIIDTAMITSYFVLITVSKLAYVPIFLLVMILKQVNYIGVVPRAIMTQKEYLLGGTSVSLAYIIA